MAAPNRSGPIRALVAAVALVALAGCSSGDDDDPRATTSTSSGSGGSSTSSTEPGTVETLPDPSASTTEPSAPTSAGGTTSCGDVTAPDGAELRVRRDLNGDGRPDLLAKVGDGAAAEVIGVFVVGADCRATRATRNDQPAEFPVGASAATASGLACEGSGTGTRLVVSDSTTSDGENFTGTRSRFRVQGTAIVADGSPQAFTYRPADDTDAARQAASLSC